MRLDRLSINRLRFFAWLNIAVLLAALISGIAVSFAADKYIGKDVFYITPLLHGAGYYFDLDELDELQIACQPTQLAYISQGSGLVAYDDFEVYTKIIYYGGAGFSLNNSQFRGGGGWAPGRDNDNVIVINDSLAWQLLGSLDALDKNVYIADDIYTVAGIVWQQSISKEDCYAYLPFAPAFDERVISSVLLQPESYSKLGYYNIYNWLNIIGKDRRDYYIVDMNRYIENIAIKYKLLLFLSALYILIELIVSSYKLLKLTYTRKKKLLVFAALFCAFVVADTLLIVLVLKGVIPEIWIPQDRGRVVTELYRTITGSGFLPSKHYLPENMQKIVKLNSYAVASLIAGAVALLNLIFVHKEKPSD